jgi:hypothetical protein
MRKTRRRNKKQKRTAGGTKPITDSELNACDKFCNDGYVKMYTKNKRKRFKTTTELNAFIDNRKQYIIDNCKRTYCNPHCPHIGKNIAKRYFCPLCKEKSMGVEKLGAITYCQYDPDI